MGFLLPSTLVRASAVAPTAREVCALLVRSRAADTTARSD
jgi:hypothetical protein